MSEQQPLPVRAAQAVITVMDRAVAISLSTFEAMHTHGVKKQPAAPLAAFKRASVIGAKGAKWSFIALFMLAAMAMVATVVVVPRPKRPAFASVAAMPGPRSVREGNQAQIERNCRAGRYRTLPEIEQAECADRPALPAAQYPGDAK